MFIYVFILMCYSNFDWVVWFQLQLSEVLARVRNFYNVLAELEQKGSTGISHKNFEKYLKSFHIDREERKRWCTILDTNQDG